MNNRRRVLVSALFLLVFFVPATCQIEDEQESFGRPNGKFYLKRDDEARIDMLYGIEQGIAFLADEGVISKESMDRYMIKGFRFSDLKEQVDQLYGDKANIRIPISYAYYYAIRKSRGDSPSDIEDWLARLRRRSLKKSTGE